MCKQGAERRDQREISQKKGIRLVKCCKNCRCMFQAQPRFISFLLPLVLCRSLSLFLFLVSLSLSFFLAARTRAPSGISPRCCFTLLCSLRGHGFSTGFRAVSRAERRCAFNPFLSLLFLSRSLSLFSSHTHMHRDTQTCTETDTDAPMHATSSVSLARALSSDTRRLTEWMP